MFWDVLNQRSFLEEDPGNSGRFDEMIREAFGYGWHRRSKADLRWSTRCQRLERGAPAFEFHRDLSCLPDITGAPFAITVRTAAFTGD
jgi:hypothetical protein